MAILWSSALDPYIKPIQYGGVRIQCVEILIDKPILLVSVYLPTKAENDKYEEFSEYIDQLFEMLQTYESTHEIIIAGDLNEDLTKQKNSRRLLKLRRFLIDTNITTDH